MASTQKNIFVYDDFSSDRPELMGNLYVDTIKGSEAYFFEFDRSWLRKTNLSLVLDPELMPYPGRQFSL